MATGESSLPWGTAADDPASIPAMYQDRWSELFGGALGDGIIGDTTGASLRLTASGTTQLTLLPGQAIVRGIHYVLSQPLVISLDAAVLGRSFLVLRYDANAQQVVATVTTSTSNPAGPDLAANPLGLWDFKIAEFTWSGGPLTQANIFDARIWKGPVLHRASGAYGLNSPTIGTQVIHPDGSDHRFIMAGSSSAPAWVSSTAADEAQWTQLVLKSGLEHDIFCPLRARMRGRWILELDGIIRTEESAYWSAPTWVQVADIPTALAGNAFSNVGNTFAPFGGRIFPVPLDWQGPSGDAPIARLATGRIRDGHLTVWVPGDAVGYNAAQFSVALKLF